MPGGENREVVAELLCAYAGRNRCIRARESSCLVGLQFELIEVDERRAHRARLIAHLFDINEDWIREGFFKFDDLKAPHPQMPTLANMPPRSGLCHSGFDPVWWAPNRIKPTW